MSIQSLLGVGASGMRAATLGVNVSAQNATNAATEGYSRRSVRQEPLPGPPQGGNGVRTNGPMRAVDRFVERRLLGSTSAHAEASSRLSSVEALDALFAEDAGLGAALDAFQSALEALSSSPSDRAVRQDLLDKSEALSAAFQRTSEGISQARKDVDLRLSDEVSRANQLAVEIDSIQTQMKKAEIGGDEASDLRDQRDQRIRELAGLLPITQIDGEDGAVSILLDGSTSLVRAEGGANPLSTTTDPTTGLLRITRDASGVAEDITDRLHGGSIGGLLAARDGALEDALTGLDQLAFDIAGAYNVAHAAGFGLDGVAGRALFDAGATASGAALAFSVSSDVAGLPDRIAAATDPTLTAGDNRNALALTALSETRFTTAGRTPSEGLSDLVASVGRGVDRAARDESMFSAALSQAQAVRDSISGVNSDDEMIALTQYQRAYEASLKVVQTADEMLQELLQMKQ
ncbi:MAG: flagellar hook-associated protein FlgK [Sandaracinaceae bacterium]|nr:flagellar hook-associated protein FlgK [Sandaracinaceae bacterium]